MLWDFLPTNLDDIKQIEVVRGPASAVWGANALTGVVNIITKSPRETPGTTASLSGGWFRPQRRIDGRHRRRHDLRRQRHARRRRPTTAGRTACRPATSTRIRFRGRRGRFPSIHRSARSDGDGRRRALSGRRDRRRRARRSQNRGTSQPKFDARVDQEIERRPASPTRAASPAPPGIDLHRHRPVRHPDRARTWATRKVNYQRRAR